MYRDVSLYIGTIGNHIIICYGKIISFTFALYVFIKSEGDIIALAICTTVSPVVDNADII